MAENLMLVISREEVESQNLTNAVSTLKSLLETPEKAKLYKENVDLAFFGYDDDTRELLEIPEVRDFAFKLDDQFPFWLFFLTKFGSGLQCLFFCMMPPFLTKEAQARIYPERLSQLLMNRWFPAMNQICEYVGMSEKEVEPLTERGVSYFTEGVFKL